MAVRIRLNRCGAKKRPSYRIVVVDSRSPRDGKYIEIVGHYHPIEKEASVVVNEEKVLDWLTKGAQLTQTVNQLFSRAGVMAKFHNLKENKKSLEKREEAQ